jgi:DNA-binding transcriptional ArsR family regulator
MITDKTKTNLTNKSGYHYMTEKIVVDNLEELIWDAISKKSVYKYPIIMREVDCHRGRADIVCAVMRKNNVDYSTLKHLGLSLSQPAKAKIFSWLDKSSPRSEEYISKVTGLVEKTIRRHLRDLLDLGLVGHDAIGKWTLGKNFKLPDIEVWAFEVKLHNWKRAFYQALRYRGFSHRITVVMPAENLKMPVKNIELFKEMNVGLMSIDQQGKLEFIKKPLREKPTSKRHYLYALGQVISEFCRLYPDYQYKSKTHFMPQLRRLFSQVLFHIQ